MCFPLWRFFGMSEKCPATDAVVRGWSLSGVCNCLFWQYQPCSNHDLRQETGQMKARDAAGQHLVDAQGGSEVSTGKKKVSNFKHLPAIVLMRLSVCGSTCPNPDTSKIFCNIPLQDCHPSPERELVPGRFGNFAQEGFETGLNCVTLTLIYMSSWEHCLSWCEWSLKCLHLIGEAARKD